MSYDVFLLSLLVQTNKLLRMKQVDFFEEMVKFGTGVEKVSCQTIQEAF